MLGFLVKARRTSGLLLAGLLIAATAPAAAQPQAASVAQSQPRLHGLLIAATEYSDPGISDMPSAAADAFLLARVLLDRGAQPSDIRVLTEGAPADALWGAALLAQSEATRNDALGLARRGVTTLGGPTRARILEELDRLLHVANAGDQAFIAISGHGEQQRTTDFVLEPDGFDEIFIPTDAVRLPDRIEGAVVDDEIGQRVQGLLAKGVQVVFVGDFCHSEGGTRGSAGRRSAGGQSDVRLLAGQVGTTDVEGRGRFTGIYAAPSLSQALALRVPYWARDTTAQRVHGALSFYLATALQDPSLATMRDVALRVERDINLHARVVTRPRLPPPQFEGDFAAPLPGSGVGLAASLWQVSKPESSLTLDGRVQVTELILPAGALNGVEQGAVYALSQTRGGQERVVLYGRAEEVAATRAVLRPVAAGELTAEAWTALLDEGGQPMIGPEIFTARLFAPGAPETVWISRPVSPPGTPTPAQAEALADLEALFQVQTRGREAASGSTAELPPYVRLVEPGAAGASLSLAFEGDALVIQDEVESGRPLARMDLARALARIRPAGSAVRLTGLRTSLAEGLNLAARFQRMRSAATRVSDVAAADGASPFDGLELSLYRHRQAGGGPCTPPWGNGVASSWYDVEGVPEGSVEIDPSDLSSPGGAQACDVFVLEVRNEGSPQVAESVLGRITDDWSRPCDRSREGATLVALGPEQAYACTQPVSVGLVVLSSDSAIRHLNSAGASAVERETGARQLNRGARARFGYWVTDSDPDFLLRTDFMVLSARSLYRENALPVHFSQLCQQSLQDAFIGPMAPGELRRPDPCLAAQGRFRSARTANTASAPPTVDGLFALLSGETTRGDAPQPVGGTAMRRLTLQVTPRPEVGQ